MDEQVDKILEFWFGEAGEDAPLPAGEELWFEDSPKVARAIEKSFGKLVAQALDAKHDGWAAAPRGRLALMLLLGPFRRKMHRDTPEAFLGEAKALQLCYDGLDDGVDQELPPRLRLYFYEAAMLAEDVDAQLASVEVYTELVAAAPPDVKALCQRFLARAEQHRDVVERFDRFPHRNNILNRTSNNEESVFLQQSSSTVGT